MVYTSSQSLDHALHLKSEQCGGKFTHRHAGLHTEQIDLLVVGLAQHIDHLLLVCRKTGKETALNACSAAKRTF